MKTLFFCLILLFILSSTNAQRKSEVVGLSMGISAAGASNWTRGGYGSSFGGYYEHYFSRWFGLASGVYYTQNKGVAIPNYRGFYFLPGGYHIWVDARDYNFRWSGMIEIPVEILFNVSGQNGKRPDVFFVPQYSFGIITEEIFSKDYGFFDPTSRDEVPFGKHRTHNFKFGIKVDYNIKTKLVLSWGLNIGFQYYDGMNEFSYQNTNLNFFLRLGRVFRKKE